MQFDLVIKGGTVVSIDSMYKADIGVVGEQIAAIAAPGSLGEAAKTIDATGKYVIPGAVDAHVHYCLPFMGETTADDFYKGSVAAAAGGVTTIIDFAIQVGQEDPLDTIAKRRDQGDGNAVIDYSLHACLTDPSDRTVQRIPKIIESGIPSFKVFMVYSKQGWMVDDGLLTDILRLSKKHGGIVGVHSENAAMIDYNVKKALDAGHTEAIYHALTKDSLTEAEAINRALYIAKHLHAPLYDFHMSVAEGVKLFRALRQEGLPYYAETCARYLFLDDSTLKRPDGHHFICSPPLRNQEHTDALWAGIRDKSISVVTSDHCAYSAKQKDAHSESFDTVPNGFEGVESLLPLMYSDGVNKGHISLNELVAVLATNPAKIFGLYPKKGAIQTGSDADITLLDPKQKKVLSARTAAMQIDWNPYEGRELVGVPVLTVSKGKVIYEGDTFKGNKGDGKFLTRSIPSEALESAIC